MTLLSDLANGSFASVIVAAAFVVALGIKSAKDFSRTGPQLREEIIGRFRAYTVFAFLRLGACAWGVATVLAASGVALLQLACIALGRHPTFPWQLAAGLVGLTGFLALRLLRVLHRSPSTIVASSQYNLSHFRAIWELLSSRSLGFLTGTALGIYLLAFAGAAYTLVNRQAWQELALLLGIAALVVLVWWWGLREREPEARVATPRPTDARPNILMIGSDTLRADRLGCHGYYRSLTPRIDALSRNGTLFTHCFVPCARTAPSLVSLMSGCWPHRHGIRDNYVADADTRLDVPLLPQILAEAGYETSATGDWAASDFSKFDFGFARVDTPPDQWNIKFLLRQGPKDLRLFLSLFAINPIGRRVLPEIYYLAGVPRTREIGRATRAELSRLGATGRPFLLTAFSATTHPPFGSEYPYYRLFADPNYRGESLFAMSRLTDPFEIIRRQGEAREEFDLEQIEDLYDGCVRSFDDEVKDTLAHLERCGLAGNTIVVVFSDHGMEFFENGSWGQGNSVFGDHSARTPLLIVDPRAPGGNAVHSIIRSIDVAPTLAELALGPSAPRGMDGVSLADTVLGKAPAPTLIARNETGIWLTDLASVPADHLRYPNLLDLLYVPDKELGTLAIQPQYRDIVVAAKDRMIRSDTYRVTYQPMRNGGAVRAVQHVETPREPGTQPNGASPSVEELQHSLDAWIDEERRFGGGRAAPPGAVSSSRNDRGGTATQG